MRGLLLSLFLVLLTPTFALSDFQGGPNPQGGGFQGPGGTGNISTVRQALSAMDDSHVVLTGYIVRRLGGDHEHYLFKDNTGEITIDVDDELFMGRTVTPQTKIRISGEVDRDFGRGAKIDVKYLEIQ
ncbi:MAG: NirD/YgiW/YdeI family stress tolerance protein [Desulfovibrio sp.]|nr:NirD/YgiW/YdeI family stress tolerance protein [Desulfovibrio sp.]